ncbi:MAG: virulence RhuM family protein [Paludibacteraceae bacterium]|nr:virulence RhuM family protein [Paludibacteraceae bacterium]
MNKELVQFNPQESAIEIYNSEDKSISLPVIVKDEMIWLNSNQMAELFGRDYKTIRKHIANALREELAGVQVVAKFATPYELGHHKGYTQVQQVEYYNLEMITSVGYRVKSVRGIQFRQWANRVLKDYIIKGYAVRSNLQLQHYNELKEVVALMSRTMELQEIPSKDEYNGLFNVIADYVYALDTLDHYDYQELTISKTTQQEPFHATYENAMEAISRLKEKFGGSALFANEKDESFRSSIGQIYQTFGGEELYPSVEEKAAMLLYLVTKNHSFSDGNKRIAAMLFLWFLSNNGILYTADGRKRIGDNTLVALTLMIAESRTEEKDIMVKVVVNLINQENQ